MAADSERFWALWLLDRPGVVRHRVHTFLFVRATFEILLESVTPYPTDAQHLGLGANKGPRETG